MNSAYLSRLCLTCSSKRTCRVAVFGCFDGDFSIAKWFFSFRYSRSITFRITTCILRVLRAANTRSRRLRDSSHSPVSRPQIPETWAHRKVKKPLKTKLKRVILNPLHLLRPDSHCAPWHIDACFHLLGWSDPRGFFATSKWRKVGSLQPNSEPLRVQIELSVVRNLFSFEHLLDRDSEREGDGQGELCLSCTRHLAALQLANRIEAL